jgi:hypothetical protein
MKRDTNDDTFYLQVITENRNLPIRYHPGLPASLRAASTALRKAKSTETDMHNGGSPVALRNNVPSSLLH